MSIFIKILEKGLDFAPVQRKINELELRSNFEEFCRRVRTKWYFCNKPTPDFSNVYYVKSKSKWRPPKITDKELGYSYFISEEWKTIQSLAENKQLLLRKLTKVPVWWFGIETILYLRLKGN